MPTNTLTSLALLKGQVDRGNDYLGYLTPFVLQVLHDDRPDPITDAAVSKLIRARFGLEIPSRSIELVLKRVARKYPIRKDHGVYRQTGDLPDPNIEPKQREVERHIRRVLFGLQQFAQDSINPVKDDDRAIEAICSFLTEFDITCLRAYLRGTVIPSLDTRDENDVVLVGQYVANIQRRDPQLFESFMVLVQGYMLANALLCPDLEQVGRSFRGVTFFLDTPLLLHALGLEESTKEEAAAELVRLLAKLGGTVAAFSHSIQELRNILRAVASNIGSPQERSEIDREIKQRGITRSDLILLDEQVEERLREAGIGTIATPRYLPEFQIDEGIFEQVLSDEVSYHNPRAREFDINSVRSIYALRRNRMVPSIEKAVAIFVTSNSSYAKAAWDFGQQHDSAIQVSSVVTSFSLANVAWLKAPLGAMKLPQAQILSVAYAALQPSVGHLGRILDEIDKLEESGRISTLEHQLLRSSKLAYDELMHLTLGHDEALTEDNVGKTIDRVLKNIKQEESAKLGVEQEQHERTKETLADERGRINRVSQSMYWRYRKLAGTIAWAISVMVALFTFATLAAATLFGFGWDSWVFQIGTGVFALLSLVGLLFGTTVFQLHGWIAERCLAWFVRRESVALGIDFADTEL